MTIQEQELSYKLHESSKVIEDLNNRINMLDYEVTQLHNALISQRAKTDSEYRAKIHIRHQLALTEADRDLYRDELARLKAATDAGLADRYKDEYEKSARLQNEVYMLSAKLRVALQKLEEYGGKAFEKFGDALTGNHD